MVYDARVTTGRALLFRAFGVLEYCNEEYRQGQSGVIKNLMDEIATYLSPDMDPRQIQVVEERKPADV